MPESLFFTPHYSNAHLCHFNSFIMEFLSLLSLHTQRSRALHTNRFTSIFIGNLSSSDKLTSVSILRKMCQTNLLLFAVFDDGWLSIAVLVNLREVLKQIEIFAIGVTTAHRTHHLHARRSHHSVVMCAWWATTSPPSEDLLPLGWQG